MSKTKHIKLHVAVENSFCECAVSAPRVRSLGLASAQSRPCECGVSGLRVRSLFFLPTVKNDGRRAAKVANEVDFFVMKVRNCDFFRNFANQKLSKE